MSNKRRSGIVLLGFMLTLVIHARNMPLEMVLQEFIAQDSYETLVIQSTLMPTFSLNRFGKETLRSKSLQIVFRDRVDLPILARNHHGDNTFAEVKQILLVLQWPIKMKEIESAITLWKHTTVVISGFDNANDFRPFQSNCN